jgi:hypothetical protein
MPQQQQQQQSYQSRPSSSTQPVQQNNGQLKNPIIMRDLDKPSGIGTQVKITKAV